MGCPRGSTPSHLQQWATITLGLSALTVCWPAKMCASTSTHIISRFTVLRHDCLIRILPKEKEAESYQQLRCNCSKWWGGVRKKQSAWWGQNWGWASSTKMEEGASLRFENPTAWVLRKNSGKEEFNMICPKPNLETNFVVQINED